MKAVILAGGFGTRISEESQYKPKPMIEVGDQPILWHIMKIYSAYGVRDFVICAGYRQHVIKEWFADYFLHTSDITFDFEHDNKIIVHDKHAEKWKVTVVDTGLNTMTGGRVRRVRPYLGEESFFLTYGDAVADVNLDALLRCHREHGCTVTLTAISIAQQKGVLDLGPDGGVRSFREKENADGAVINGGFMVCEPGLFDYLQDDTTVLEQEPMRRLAADGQLMSYRHDGYWQCMDTKREKDRLDALWNSGAAPWKIWQD